MKICVEIPDPDAVVEHYKRDGEFAWPAFTSTSRDKQVSLGFGNILFEIRCYPAPGTCEDDAPEFAPASIKQWSVIGEEEEILFPPNTKFRVVNIKYPDDENNLPHPMVQCETLAFDSVWGLIAQGDHHGLHEWCKQNLDRVSSQSCEYDLLGAAVQAGGDDEDGSDEEAVGGKIRSRSFSMSGPQALASVLKQHGAHRDQEAAPRRRQSGCATC